MGDYERLGGWKSFLRSLREWSVVSVTMLGIYGVMFGSIGLTMLGGGTIAEQGSTERLTRKQTQDLIQKIGIPILSFPRNVPRLEEFVSGKVQTWYGQNPDGQIWKALHVEFYTYGRDFPATTLVLSVFNTHEPDKGQITPEDSVHFALRSPQMPEPLDIRERYEVGQRLFDLYRLRE